MSASSVEQLSAVADGDQSYERQSPHHDVEAGNRNLEEPPSSVSTVEKSSAVADGDQAHEWHCPQLDVEAGNGNLEESRSSFSSGELSEQHAVSLKAAVSSGELSERHAVAALKAVVANNEQESNLLLIDTYWMGFASACAVYTLWSKVVHSVLSGKKLHQYCLPDRTVDATVYLTKEQEFVRIFQASVNLVLPLLAWGFLSLAWTRARCDYIGILGLKGHGALLPANAYVRRGCQLFIFTCFCKYVFAQTVDCRPEFAFLRPWVLYLPALQLLGICLYTAKGIWRSQCIAIRLIFLAITAPFSATGILPHSSFVANWMSSLTKPLVDLSFMLCYYTFGEDTGGLRKNEFCYQAVYGGGRVFTLGHLILIFPNCVRIAQLLRQFCDKEQRHPCLTNALKYVLSLCVTLVLVIREEPLSPDEDTVFFWCWFSLVCFSQLYAFIWDITMDMGFLCCEKSRLCIPLSSISLRRHSLIFASSKFYALAMALDFVARFFFVYTLLPHKSLELSGDWIKVFNVCNFIAPTIEIFRRAMWSLFTVEFKQVQKNCKDLEKMVGHDSWKSPRGVAFDMVILGCALCGLFFAKYAVFDEYFR